MRIARLLLLLGLPCAVGLRARAEVPAQPNGFTQELSPETAERIVVRIPLVRDEGARVVVSRSEESDGDFLERYALRRAEPHETPTHFGLATIYRDRIDVVRGDGRVAWVGELVLQDAKTKKVVDFLDVQVKGVPTGLLPNGAKAGEAFHASGLVRRHEAIHEYLRSGFLHENQIDHADVVGVIDTGRTLTTTLLGGQPLPWTEGTALIVRRGDFLNLGHLVAVESSPEAVRELLDLANRRLSRKLGRRQLLPWGELYREIVRRTAATWADLYFARVVVGATTLDNNGVIQPLRDLATMKGLDRTHHGFEAPTERTAGFGLEGEDVLEQGYAGELLKFMRLAAATDEERRQVEGLDVLLYGQRAYRLEMRARLLSHLGFNREDARDILDARTGGNARRTDVDRLLKVFLKLASRRAEGEQVDGWERVIRPAQYDVFQALTKLVELRASDKTPEQKVELLARELAAKDAPQAEVMADAAELLQSAAPVIDRGLSHLTGTARGAKVVLLTAKAAEINRPPDSLRSVRLSETVDALLNRVDPIDATIRQVMRSFAFRGPRTGHGAAELLRAGGLPRLPDGRVVLSSDSESTKNGLGEYMVTLQEVSDGLEEKLRVVLEGSAAGVEPEDRALAYELNGVFGRASGHLVEGRRVFELPLRRTSEPPDVKIGFARAGEPNDRWIGGAGVISGYRFVAWSPVVDAELASWRQRHYPEAAPRPVAPGFLAAARGRMPRGVPAQARELEVAPAPRGMRETIRAAFHAGPR